MNKETEMYLIRRIEDLTERNALLSRDIYELQNKPKEYEYDIATAEKAKAFDAIKPFLVLRRNGNGQGGVVAFEYTTVELDEFLTGLFEELING